MPTYEYLCEGCGHRFDEFQSFKDEPLKVCPRCAEEKLRRLFGTGAAILFKGSGFYETDYRSESYKSAAKKDEEASKPAADKGADKPAAKADTNGTTAPAAASAKNVEAKTPS
jgi:putative FmdB family regulatory protein